MPVMIGEYSLKGPFSRPEEVRETQGLYVVLAEDIGDEGTEPAPEMEVIEVGFAKNLRDELISHENQDQWNIQYEGRLFAGILYTDEHSEHEIKQAFANIQPGVFSAGQNALCVSHDPDENDEDDADEDDASEDEADEDDAASEDDTASDDNAVDEESIVDLEDCEDDDRIVLQLSLLALQMEKLAV